MESTESRLARIEEKINALAAAQKQGLDQLLGIQKKNDTVVTGLTRKIERHSDELAKNRADHKWAFGILTLLSGVFAAFIKTRI